MVALLEQQPLLLADLGTVDAGALRDVGVGLPAQRHPGQGRSRTRPESTPRARDRHSGGPAVHAHAARLRRRSGHVVEDLEEFASGLPDTHVLLVRGHYMEESTPIRSSHKVLDVSGDVAVEDLSPATS